MHKNMSENNRHNRRLYYQSRAKCVGSIWLPSEKHVRWLKKNKKNLHLLCLTLSEPFKDIWYHTMLSLWCVEGRRGRGNEGGLWKGKWEGGFVSIFPTVGIGNKQMLSIMNRLPSFSNEEVKGWRVGCKWGADEQQSPSTRPACDVA